MELNVKEKKLLSKLNNMCKRKKQWYFAIILVLLVSIIYLLIFIDSRAGEHLLISIFCFFTFLYALDKLRIAQLVEKIDKNTPAGSSS